MSRIWGRIASVLGVAVFASAAAPGCMDDQPEAIFIRGALAPPTSRQNNQCVYTNDPSQPMLTAGSLDLGIKSTYGAMLLVGNQLTARADPNDNRAESNRIQVTGVEVRVTLQDGTSLANFSAPAGGIVDPQSGNTPSYGTVGAMIIDSSTANALKALLPANGGGRTVLSFIRVVGTSLGQKELKSGELQFPISVCNGCLVDYSNGTDPTKPLPNCAKPFSADATAVVPCSKGQDEYVPCQLCQGLDACDPTKR